MKGVAGDYAVGLIKVYEKKRKSLSDEEIARALKLKVTEVRTILNRLHYRGISFYHKSKNRKTGWYSYTWDIKIKRLAELLLEVQEERLEKLQNRKVMEGTFVYFSCKKSCDNILFEIAAEYQFRCPDCGENMVAIDIKKQAKETEKQLTTLRDEIVALREIKLKG